MLQDSPKPCTAACFYKVTCAFFILALILFSSTFSQASLAVQEIPPQGTVGISYNTVLTVTGGATPYSSSGPGRPAGLNMSPTAATTIGVPKTSGPFPVNVTVTDAYSNKVTAIFSIV